MHRIGILTFHRAANYGAVLQAYALQKTLAKNQFEAEIIDYRCKFIEEYYKPIMLFHPRNIKRLIAAILYNGMVFPKRDKYFSFLVRHSSLSQQSYYSEDELKKTNDYYDAFIAGSDQVWNYKTAGFDKAYFLAFVNNQSKKISYAASIGLSSIPEQYIAEYKTLLSSFHNHSVRESDGQNIIESLLNRASTVDLDPTLLLTQNEWRAIIDTKEIRKGLQSPDKYILLYTISENKELRNYAIKIAREQNAKILYINNRWHHVAGVTNIRYASIDEWLYLFLNAEAIITDSFHGTAFSVNFHKPFISFVSMKAKTGSRIRTLLCRLCLQDQIISENDFKKPIIRLNVDKTYENKLSEMRKASINNLLEYLKGACHGE